MTKNGKKDDTKSKKKTEAAKPEVTVEQAKIGNNAKSTTGAPSEEQALAALKTIAGDITSTVLRDHFKLDKETGRDVIRRIMKTLAADGKVVITERSEKGKRKQYFYKLK